MKRFSKSLFICLVLCLSFIFFTACGETEKEIKVESIVFELPVVNLLVGQSYTAGAILMPDNAKNQKITYGTPPVVKNGVRITILEKTGTNVFLAKKEGITTIYAMSSSLGPTNKIEQTVRVFNSVIKLDNPVGLRYDGEKVLWNDVTYSVFDTEYSAQGYIVNLNGEDLPFTAVNELRGLQAGVLNTIKVKACESDTDIIEDSNYSSELKVFILNTPTNVQRDGNTVSWDAVDSAYSYDIYVNNELYKSNIIGTSTDIDFDVSGSYSLSVVANPQNDSEYMYQSYPSNAISVEKLETVENISFDNNILTWNEVVEALEYKVVFDIDGESVVYENGVHTTFDIRTAINDLGAGDYSVSVIAVSNKTSGINSEKSDSVPITKLSTPSNLRIENNKLVWDLVDNAVSYGVSVNGGDIINVEDSYTLPEDSVAGTYEFKLITYGDGERYFDSNLMSEGFVAVKIDEPTNIYSKGNTIYNSNVENAVRYVYYDVSDANNIVEFTEDDIISVIKVEEENIAGASLVFKDKIDLEDIANEWNISNKNYLYSRLQEKLNENYFKIKVKAIANNDGNYFDSSLSSEYVDVWKLFSPLWFAKVPMDEIGKYDGNTLAWDNSISFGTNKTTIELYNQVGFINEINPEQRLLTSKVRFMQYKDGVLVERFVHYIDSIFSPLTEEEMDSLEGGKVYISLAFAGNNDNVIDSDYINLSLAENWTYDKNTGALIVTEWSDETLILNKMYEAYNFTVSGSILNFSSKNTNNAIYELYLKGENNNYDKVASSTTTSIDLSEIINRAGNYNFVIVCKPLDNTDYFSTIIESEEMITGVCTFNNDKFSYESDISIFTITSLDIPKITLNQGCVVWDEIDGASDYEIFVNNKVVDNAEIIKDNGKCRWLCNVYNADIYNIKVRAFADSSEDGQLIINSAFSDEIECSRLEINGYVVENNSLTVETDEENVDLVLAIKDADGQTIQNIISNEMFIDLSRYLVDAGNYGLYFYLKQKDFVSQDKLTSVVFGEENAIRIVVLENPEFVCENYNLSWNPVVNALGYILAYRVCGSSEVLFSELITGTEFNLATFESFEAGIDYEITLFSYGENNIVSSRISFENAINFNRCNGVENFNGYTQGDNYILEWTKITGAVYDIYMNNTYLASTNNNSYSVSLTLLTKYNETTFNVVAKLVNSDKAPSLPSESVVIKKLNAPEFTLENGTFVITNNDDNNSIYIQIYSNAENSIVYSGYCQGNEIALDKIEEFGNGTYTLFVRFDGNGVDTITSDFSQYNDIQRQKGVSNVALDKTSGEIIFDAVNGVTSYKVIFMQNECEDVVAFTNKARVAVPDEVGAGQVRVVVCAVGDNSNTVTSLISQPLVITRLQSPSNVRVVGGVLSFDKVDGFNDYIVSVNGNNVVFDENLSFDFSKEGVYDISVVTKGNYIDTVDSSYATQLSVVRLGKIQGLKVQNNEITWDIVNYASKYKVVLNGVNTYNFEVEENSFIPSNEDIDAGTYTVTVFACGDGDILLDGESASIGDVTLLEKPANVKLNESGYIVWESVEKAIQYKLEITYCDEVEEIVLTDNMYLLPADMQSGDYSICVSSVGNGLKWLNSSKTELLEVKKFAKPLSITQHDGVISISEVEGATTYVIVIDMSNGGKEIIKTTTLDTDYSFEDAVTYTLTCYCEGDYINSINSDISESFQVVRMAKPQVTIENQRISWLEDDVVASNDFSYNIVVIKDDEVKYDNQTTNNYFEFDFDKFGEGYYTIKVRALSVDEISYLSSEFTVISDIYKFPCPVIYDKLKSNKVTWSTVNNVLYVSGYEVRVTDENNVTKYEIVDGASDRVFELGNAYNAGVYKIAVRILTNEEKYIDSKFSEEKEICMLPNPTITISKKDTSSPTSEYIASWGRVNGATSYDVTIGGNYICNTKNNYIVLDDYVKGGETYIRVKAVGDNDNGSYYVSSNNTVNTPFVALDSAALGLKIENGVIVWSEIENVECYLLQINEVVINCGTSTSYELSSSFNCDNYNISIKAISAGEEVDGLVCVNSSYSRHITGHKLATPATIKIVDGKLVFSAVDYENNETTPNTLRYIVSYGTKVEVVTLDKSSVEGMTKTFYSNNIGEVCEIKCKAMGDRYNLNSDWTTVISGVQLETVTNIQMSNRTLTWNAVEHATKYKLTANCVDPRTNASIQRDIELDYLDTPTIENPFYTDEIRDSGAIFYVSIVAIGSENTSGGTIAYTNSKESYATIVYLPKVTDIQTVDGKLVWNGSSSFGYDILVDDSTNVVKDISTEDESMSYELDNISAGMHKVKIRLRGNSSFYMDGQWSEEVVVYKLDTPKLYENVHIENGQLVWGTDSAFLDDYQELNIGLLGIFNKVEVEITASEIEPTIVTYVDLATELIGGVYKSKVLDYFDNVEEGSYYFRIKNVGNTGDNDTNRFVNSSYSEKFSCKVLSIPKDVAIENGYLTWTNVPNNEGYIIFVGNNGSVTKINLPKSQDQDACFLNVSDYDVGSYTFEIRAVGDNSTYLTSNKNIAVKMEVLSAPSNIGLSEGALVWNIVENAIGYNVKIVNTDNNAENIYTNVTTTFDELNRVVYEFPEDLGAGNYNVYVMSVGNNTTYITSKYSQIPKTVLKSSEISGFGNTQGELSFETKTVSGYNVVGYQFKVLTKNPRGVYDREVTIKAYTIPTNDGLLITVRDGIGYFELPSSVLAGELCISIRALGNNASIVSSNYSEPIYATKLSSVGRVYVSNGIVNWDYDENYGTGYYIVVDDGAVIKTYSDLITATSAEFPADLPEGKYTTYIQVVGNTVSASSTSGRYLNSNIGDGVVISKLASVNSFMIMNGKLVWDKSDNAEKYEITFVKDGQTIVETVSRTNYDSSLQKCYYEPIGLANNVERFSYGNYTKISIRAIGDNNSLNSQAVELNNIYKIERPSAIDIEDQKYLTWSIITYKQSGSSETVRIPTYRFRLTLPNYQSRFIDWSYDGDYTSLTDTMKFRVDINDLLSGTSSSGDYQVSIQALALSETNEMGQQVWNALNSDFSEPKLITKPASPQNLTYDSSIKAFKWDRPTVDSSLTVKYVVSYIYKSNINASEQQMEEEVSTNYFYPRKLGLYKLVVKAVVTSMESDYIGASKTFATYKGTFVEFINECGVGCTHDLFERGEGSQDNPYIIRTENQLYNMNYYYLEGMHFELANHITITTSNFTIGSQNKPFSGVFDGNNYEIRGLRITQNSGSLGLFAYARLATIKNLTMSNAMLTTIAEKTVYAGIVLGYGEAVNLENILVSSNCSITLSGTTSSTCYLGGVVGYEKNYSGNGFVYAKNIRNCGSITFSNQQAYSGGIAGYYEAEPIDGYGFINCLNEGAISGAWVGGIVGFCDAYITNCANKGALNGVATKIDVCVGGIVGKVKDSIVIRNTYNIGTLTASLMSTSSNIDVYVGGALGYGQATITNFYNSGAISATKNNAITNTIGWLVGNSVGVTASNCFTTTDLSTTSGKNGVTAIGACGQTTIDELKSGLNSLLGNAFTTSGGTIILVMESSLKK